MWAPSYVATPPPHLHPTPRSLDRMTLGLNQKNYTMDFTLSDERGNKKESSSRHTCGMQVLWTYSGGQRGANRKVAAPRVDTHRHAHVVDARMQERDL